MHTDSHLPGVPLISVVIVCYTGNVQYIDRAMTSLARQSFKNFDVTLAYDGPLADNSQDEEIIIKGISSVPFPVHVYDMPERTGFHTVPRNRHTATTYGRYIFNMDADNEVDPHHFQELLKAIRTPVSGRRPDFVYSRRRYVKDPTCTEDVFVGTSPLVPWDIGKVALGRGAKYNFIDTGDMLVPKSVLYSVAEATGEIWNCNISRFPDFDLCKRMAQCGMLGQEVDIDSNVYHWTGKNIQLTEPGSQDILVLSEGQYEGLIEAGLLKG